MAEYLKLEILNYDQFIRPLSGLIFKTSALPKKFNILFELFLPGATEVYMDKNSTKSHVANSGKQSDSDNSMSSFEKIKIIFKAPQKTDKLICCVLCNTTLQKWAIFKHSPARLEQLTFFSTMAQFCWSSSLEESDHIESFKLLISYHLQNY